MELSEFQHAGFTWCAPTRYRDGRQHASAPPHWWAPCVERMATERTVRCVGTHGLLDWRQFSSSRGQHHDVHRGQ